MEDYQKLCTIDINPRPYVISLNADGSCIVLKCIDDCLYYYKRIDNKWQLKTKQYIKKLNDNWKMQLNQQGNLLALISRRSDKFWYDVLIYDGRKFLLHNSFSIKNDPDQLRSLFYFKIADSLRFCSSEFQWRNGYKRIHSFSTTVRIKRLRKQIVRGMSLEFYDNLFAIKLGQQILVYQIYTLQRFSWFQSDSYIYSFTFQNKEKILVHNEVGLIEFNYIKDNQREILLFGYQINKKDDFLAVDDLIFHITNKITILKRVKQRVDVVKEIFGGNIGISKFGNVFIVESKKENAYAIYGADRIEFLLKHE